MGLTKKQLQDLASLTGAKTNSKMKKADLKAAIEKNSGVKLEKVAQEYKGEY